MEGWEVRAIGKKLSLWPRAPHTGQLSCPPSASHSGLKVSTGGHSVTLGRGIAHSYCRGCPMENVMKSLDSVQPGEVTVQASPGGASLQTSWRSEPLGAIFLPSFPQETQGWAF